MSKVLEEYFFEFDEYPPLLMTMTYDDDFYINLMNEAIKTKTKITMDILEKAVEKQKIKYDFI